MSKTMNFTLILMLVTMSVAANAGDGDEAPKPFRWEATYTGEVVRNMSGGLEVGTTELGLLDVRADFDFRPKVGRAEARSSESRASTAAIPAPSSATPK